MLCIMFILFTYKHSCIRIYIQIKQLQQTANNNTTTIASDSESAALIAQLTADLEASEANAAELSETLNTYYDRLRQGSEYTMNITAELESVKAQLERQQGGISVDELTAKDESIAQLTANLTASEKKVAELSESLNIYYDRFQKLAEFARGLQAEGEVKDSTIAELQQQLASTTSTTDGQANHEEALAQLTADLAASEEKVAELTDNLNAYYDRLQQGGEYARTLKAESEAKDATITELQAQLSSLQAQLSSTASRQDEELLTRDARITELTAELAISEDRIAELSENLNVYYDRLQKVSEYAKTIKAESETYQETLASKEATIAELHTKLSTQIPAAAFSVSQPTNHVDEEALAQLTADLAASEEKVAELTDNLNAYYDRLQQGGEYARTLKAESEAKDVIIIQLRQQLASTSSVSTTNGSSVNDNQELVTQLQADLQASEERITELSENLNLYYSRLQQGAEYTKTLREQLSTVTSDLEVAQAQLAAYTTNSNRQGDNSPNNTNNSHNNEESAVEASQLKEAINKLRADNTQLDTDKQVLSSRLSVLQQSYDALQLLHQHSQQLHSSTTTPTTAPTTNTTNTNTTPATTAVVEYQQQITHLNSKITNLTNLIEEYTTEINNKDTEINELKEELNQNENKIEELSNQCQSYYTRLQAGKDYTTQLQSEYNRIVEEGQIYKEKLEQKQDEINRLLIEISVFQSLAEDAEDKLKAYNNNINTADASNTDSNVQQGDGNDESSVAIGGKLHPQAEVDEYIKQIQTLTNSLQIKEKEASEYTDQIKSLTLALDAALTRAKTAEATAAAASLPTNINSTTPYTPPHSDPDPTTHTSPSTDVHTAVELESVIKAKETLEADMQHMVEQLIETKMNLAHMSQEIENEKQVSRSLRIQLAALTNNNANNNSNNSNMATPNAKPTPKKGMFR